MPGVFLHMNTGMTCFHQLGVTTVGPSQPRVRVSGNAVASASTQITVAGCPFVVPVPPPPATKPQPCVRVQWAMQSLRVKVLNQPVLLQTRPGPGTGAGICQSVEGIPQGAPSVSAIQPRVAGM